MKDFQIKARISEQQKKCLDDIVSRIEKIIPAGEITLSSLIRQAIDDYIKSYYIQNIESGIKLEIPLSNMSNDELEIMYKLLFDMQKITKKSMFTSVQEDFSKSLDVIRLKIVSDALNTSNSSLKKSSEEKEINQQVLKMANRLSPDSNPV